MVVDVKIIRQFIFVLFLLSGTVFAQDKKTTEDPKNKDGIPERKVDLLVGDIQYLKLDFVPSGKKIQSGEGSSFSSVLVPQKKQIALEGLKPPGGSIILFTPTGDAKLKILINVTATDQSKVLRQLRDFLGDVEGIEMGVKGDSVYVGGNIVVPSEIGKVVVVLEKFPEVLRLVELAPQTQAVIARKMQDEIQKFGAKDVTVRIVNNRFWLEGVVNSNNLRDDAFKIATAYLPDRIESLARRTDAVQRAPGASVIQNFITVDEKPVDPPEEKQLKISSQFVELSKDYNRVFGFKWRPTLGGGGGEIRFGKTQNGGITTRSDGTLSGTISNLFPKLASAKAAGYARVIQSGTILVKDKTQGFLQKQETTPFAIGSGEFQRAENAQSGFNLTVTPTIKKQEKIEMNVSLTVSSQAGSPPSTISNNVRTNVIVKNKESAVIGGIVLKSSSTGFDRDPPFGNETTDPNDPTSSFLFSFVRSKSYSTNKSQFAVFITPEIVESASKGTEDVKRKFRRRRR